MASKKVQKNLAVEITGIILAGFSLFLVCCLISFNPEDPSFVTGYSTLPGNIQNWGGVAGSYLSSLLLQFFGAGAFVFPFVIILLAFKLFFSPSFSLDFYIRTLLLLFLFLCVEAYLALYFNSILFNGFEFGAGGVVGFAIAELLVGYLNVFGAYLVLGLCALIIVIVLTKISFITLWHRFYAWLKPLVAGGIEFVKKKIVRVYETTQAKRAEKNNSPPDFIKKNSKNESPDEAVFPEQETPLDPEIRINLNTSTSAKHILTDEGAGFEPKTAKPVTDYRLPDINLLDVPIESETRIDRTALQKDADILLQKLADFSVKGSVVEISPGPVITRFEFEPAPGIKLNRIVGLSEDLALALKAMSVRIAPIAGKSVVGIEVPNKKRKPVLFREIVCREEFLASRSKLTIGLGKDIGGTPIISDLSRMPHLLVAGTTGSGKSVFVNTVICSILYKATPDEVRFLMVDPKRLELSPYEGIPHLLHPVVVEPKKAAMALQWVVNEMDRRYRTIAEFGTRNIIEYNKKLDEEEKKGEPLSDEFARMPYIVVIIDELADLMMVAARDVETYIARLAQMARASGIHLLIATQRPSVDILTGIIKANFSCRISFQVSSKVDSRTILDTMGAEKLLGMGDMLFMPPGSSRLQRIHGAFLSEKEIKKITRFIKQQRPPLYDESIVADVPDAAEPDEEEGYDEFYDRAVAIVTETRQASISMLQRRMRVGYNRAARMIERMEKEGVVGQSDGVKPREVLAQKI